jgi:iron complex outermembrane receptor protein
VKATDTLSFSGVGYYRSYKNRVVDGNLTEADECHNLDGDDDDTNDTGHVVGGVDDDHFLCLDEGEGDPLLSNGTPTPIDVEALGLDEPFGSIERLATTSRSWGGVIEGQERAKLFGMRNLFLAGVSYDHGESNYKTSSELGTIGPGYVVDGTGIIVSDEEDETSPRDLDAENTYWGVYFSDALDVTDQLTVTVGGRYNYARIKLTDNTGLFEGLNATNTYERFNPMVGANYKLMKGVSVYGGYSESNRAPTPAELGCAEEDNPCLIESFLTDDPPLEQVVGRTAELGLRGQGSFNGGYYTWGAGLFRTLASDDILPVTLTSGGSSRIFFVNAGDTLRQGVELSGTYETRKWSVYGSYAFVDATLDQCTNPGEDDLCAFLASGDRLPGIPRHRFKAGFDYWLTPKWKFGADLVAASEQPLFPNEAKEDADADGISSMLGGYGRVDLHTSYDVTEKFQIYGLVKNLFDSRYGLYGTYFEEPDEVPVFGRPALSDPRTISPSMPFAAYGGVKIKY